MTPPVPAASRPLAGGVVVRAGLGAAPVGVARSSGFGSRSVSLIISLGSTQHRNPATFRAVCALALASLEPLAPLEQVGHVLASESSIELEGRAQLLEGLAGGPRVDDLHAILLYMLLVFCQQQRP